MPDHLTPFDPKTNPRFVWNIGAIQEEFPDMPEPKGAEVTLYDRQERAPVVTLHGRYGQLFCLETTPRPSLCLEIAQPCCPFTDLETWINLLDNEALESEGLPVYTSHAK